MGYVIKALLICTSMCYTFSAFLQTACPDGYLLCGDGSKCILYSELCNNIPTCEDASDETNYVLCQKLDQLKGRRCDYQFGIIECKQQDRNKNNDYYSLREKCFDIITACTLGKKCLNSTQFSICDEIADFTLKPSWVEEKKSKERKEDPPHNFYKMVEFLSNFFNETVSRNLSTCPPFFNLYMKNCFSFFTPAKVTWLEAKQLCESMSGRLAVLDDVRKYKIVLDYIYAKDIKGNFWIGGRSKDDLDESGNSSKSWSWVNHKPVEMGTPFWSLTLLETNSKYVCSKIKNSLKPNNRNDNKIKKCLAIMEENYYYFSDEDCNRLFSPICIAK